MVGTSVLKELMREIFKSVNKPNKSALMAVRQQKHGQKGIQ